MALFTYLTVSPFLRRKTSFFSSPMLLCYVAVCLPRQPCSECLSIASAAALSPCWGRGSGPRVTLPRAPAHRRTLRATRYAHALLFIAEKPHNETSLRNHTDMYSGESTLASGAPHVLTPPVPNPTHPVLTERWAGCEQHPRASRVRAPAGCVWSLLLSVTQTLQKPTRGREPSNPAVTKSPPSFDILK